MIGEAVVKKNVVGEEEDEGPVDLVFGHCGGVVAVGRVGQVR